ncbi:MAG: hypothetical protein O2973_04505 [Gemmatimonadetes bacterium]|nr:hypothetical protein [Gemmatimonadota bacterium]
MEFSTAASRTVIVRAPTRVDLGGGWTDVPPYCDEQGGFVCNVAINRYATATVRADETYRPDAAAGAPTSTDPLVAAALRRAGVSGVRVELTSDFPVSSGLGGSSAASAAVLGALDRWRGVEHDRAAIAEAGRSIEVEEMRIAGGRQDHYAATYGGALALTFTEAVAVNRIPVSSETAAEFERRGILVYTGESRVSGSTIHAVIDAYRDRDPRVRGALLAMKTLAAGMAEMLESGDIDTLGAMIAEHWLHQRELHPSIPTARIDEIVMRAHGAGACGAKAMGASGGGCVFVLSAADNVDAVRAAVVPLGEIVPFAIDHHGLADVAPEPISPH